MRNKGSLMRNATFNFLGKIYCFGCIILLTLLRFMGNLSGTMSFVRNYRSQGGTLYNDRWPSFNRNSFNNRSRNMNMNRNNNNYNQNWNYNNFPGFSGKFRDHVNNNINYVKPPPNDVPSLKRRKFSVGTWGDGGRYYLQPSRYESSAQSNYHNSVPPPMRSNTEASTSISCKRDRSKLEDEEPVFMSKDEIERYSPSRKDGIDALREAHLRYSYCAFLQNLGMRLEL